MSASLPAAISPFLRIHAEDARRRGGGDLHETVQRKFARVDAVVINQLQTVLDARAAVGNLREIVFAEDLLVFETERAVVGGDHLQMIVLQTFPEFRQVLFGAQGRRENIFRAFEIRPLQLFDGEQQILRAGFGESRDAAVARFAHLVERVLRREMHDVHRHAGDLGHGDGAMHRFGFGDGGAGERVIDGRGLAFGQRFRDDHVDHAAVFGVHADQRAVLRGARERFENGRVIHHQDVRIGHEQLETGHAFVHHVVHIFQAAMCPGR